MKTYACTWVEPTVILASSSVSDRSSWIRRGTSIMHSNISDGVFIGFRCSLQHVQLGEASMMGAKCRLLGTQDAPISVGRYSWIGAGVTVEPGVRIGEGAVIGAGSYVTSDVPDYMVAAGRPAVLRKMRQVTNDGIPEFGEFLSFIRQRSRETPLADDEAQIGDDCFITATIQAGRHLRVGSRSVLIGGANEEGVGGIHAGDDVVLGTGVILEALGGIRLGDQVEIDDEVLMVTTTHEYEFLSLPQLRQPIVVESKARIGRDSIIIGGVTIGEGAVILPGSLVLKHVLPYDTVSGVPAQSIIQE
ncbi:acyltransferase [Paenibacillus zeisoli]|uniref:acyltransferase n=1 Tax=Paenibacillus zeisoli TaxID=2496267 RepID=UPI00163BDD45|nr:acyltransferase [Paenibacillus zeisoli]